MFEGMSMGNLDPNMLAYFMGAMGGAISPEGSFGKNLSPAVMAMAGNKMQEANMQKKLSCILLRNSSLEVEKFLLRVQCKA